MTHTLNVVSLEMRRIPQLKERMNLTILTVVRMVLPHSITIRYNKQPTADVTSVMTKCLLKGLINKSSLYKDIK